MRPTPLIASFAALFMTGFVSFAKEEAPASPYAGTGDLKIDKPEDKEDVKPVPAPEGAIVLFNGKDVSDWVSNGGGEAKWDVVDGVLQGKPGTGDIVTKHQFEGAYKLHVEFRVPYEPNNHDQGRGNSGVYLNSHWEVQVLDSYHNTTYADGACGAIYSIEPPKENAAKAPTIWQSYDIEFHPAKCEDGKVVERPTADGHLERRQSSRQYEADQRLHPRRQRRRHLQARPSETSGPRPSRAIPQCLG